MKEAISKIGLIERPVTTDLFTALLESIVGQQISTKAQKTICARIHERCAPITPFHIYALPPETIQGCGISKRKTLYIQEMAEAVVAGDVELDALDALSDEEVIDCLCKLKGIGRWTGEMLLIFSCMRPNVFSYDDLAIQRGLRLLYRHRKITPALFEKYRRRFSPYCTVASLYLWAIAGGAIPALKDPAPKKQTSKTKKTS